MDSGLLGIKRLLRTSVPLFCGSSTFESLILSHHSRFTCECNKEDINDDNDDCVKLDVFSVPVV